MRTNGGVPATIGVVDGVATVGMREEEIVQLCSSVKDGGDEGTWKVSRRDLGFILGGVCILYSSVMRLPESGSRTDG